MYTFTLWGGLIGWWSIGWRDDRLLFDGTRILDEQTASDLDIEDGDSIEVLLERESYLRNGFISIVDVWLIRAEVGGQ